MGVVDQYERLLLMMMMQMMMRIVVPVVVRGDGRFVGERRETSSSQVPSRFGLVANLNSFSQGMMTRGKQEE